MNAAGVARELAVLGPAFRLVGVGGSEMEQAGVQLFEHVQNLAVMGFAGLLAQLPKHWLLLNEIRSRLASGRVALVILVDYGGFNLQVASAAKSAGIPVLYYITPQVWASRPGRLRHLAATVTKAAVIFKFEESLLQQNGVDAVFVGHPMLDRAAVVPARAEARGLLRIGADRKLLVLFPGSRQSEIERHLIPFVETARRLTARDATLDVLVSRAPNVRIDAARCPFPTMQVSSWTLLRAADAALCKSGTTTLEAAVAGCPFVIGYRASSVDYAIARQIVLVDHIGMVNVVAGREIVPEFIQDDVDPARMVPVLRELLDASSARRLEMVAALATVREALGSRGASRRVAALAADMARESVGMANR